MQIEINGKRNITLDFNAPKKFRLTQNGAEIPYVRTGKNSFRLSKNIDGVVDLEEIIEQPRYMQPVQLQPQQVTVVNPQDVERLNEAVRQMALVNPNDVMIINQTAEQLEKNQNFIAQTQKEITDNQVYIDQQQQRLNESALGIQALETNNSQRLDNAETAIYSLAGEVENTKSAVIDGLNATLGKIDQQGAVLQAEIDTKADKEEIESLKKDIEEKSDRFSSAMANYSGGTAYDTLPQGGEAGQILAKRTDRQGDYIWIDQTPVIVKSETIPTASEKYKGEVYQYVGETGEYTHGYIYECQQNGTSYEWVRLDVQPNTAVWGQITGLLSDQTDLQEALDDKQDKLTQTQMDAVNSGANQSNIAQIETNKTNINTINSKIPAQASSSNQLADKEFVNSSISTNTAYFIGTFNSVAELNAYSGTLTNNDYAFVVRTDAQGNTVYDRYKYTDATTPASWVFEYTLNNSSFTASQWQAINSGITDDLVGEFKAKGALLDYANDVLSLEDSNGNVLSSVTIQASAPADVVNYTNITNCITEIPQDIKLELKDGTLTLKAGSKVYVPNGKNADGSNKFDVVTIASDISLTQSWGSSQTFLLFCDTNGSRLGIYDTGRCYSGTTSVSDGAYYNTNDNKLYIYDGGSVNYQTSLPIAMITGQSPTITSIDQVFNGFGYIGSTIFALPGVKGLIPNGRNADGSLKNIAVEFTNVVTQTFPSNLSLDVVFGAGTSDITVNGCYKYDEQNNYNYDDSTIWQRYYYAIGHLTNGKITSFTPKTAFHAVDYNDLEDKLNYLNNPFSLLDYKWSEYELSNASWLLSNGAFHSGATYVAVYELLLKIHNGTETKAGVSVKLSTEAYTDTDFVINTADTTFRLPIKVKLASGKAVVGNGMTLGLTDGTTNYGQTFASGGSGAFSSVVTGAYGANLPNTISSGTRPTNNTNLGVTTDPTKSGIETSSSGLKLYFYVGETIQDANVIAASQVLTDIADLKAHSIVETYVNGTSWYRVYSDGWCEQGGYASSASAITLLKSFKDTNYTITVALLTDVNKDYTSKTTTGFSIGASGSWQTSGYIA